MGTTPKQQLMYEMLKKLTNDFEELKSERLESIELDIEIESIVDEIQKSESNVLLGIARLEYLMVTLLKEMRIAQGELLKIEGELTKEDTQLKKIINVATKIPFGIGSVIEFFIEFDKVLKSSRKARDYFRAKNIDEYIQSRFKQRSKLKNSDYELLLQSSINDSK